MYAICGSPWRLCNLVGIYHLTYMGNSQAQRVIHHTCVVRVEFEPEKYVSYKKTVSVGEDDEPASAQCRRYAKEVRVSEGPDALSVRGYLDVPGHEITRNRHRTVYRFPPRTASDRK